MAQAVTNSHTKLTADRDDGSIVLFDGVCHLCEGTVSFIIERDPAARFRFAPLQSEPGQTLARQFGVADGMLDSVLLIEKQQIYNKSAAMLRILKRLRFPWPLMYCLVLVPRPVRDRVYDFVGRHRYRWFGRRDACLVPGPGVSDRFLLSDDKEPQV